MGTNSHKKTTFQVTKPAPFIGKFQLCTNDINSAKIYTRSNFGAKCEAKMWHTIKIHIATFWQHFWSYLLFLQVQYEKPHIASNFQPHACIRKKYTSIFLNCSFFGVPKSDTLFLKPLWSLYRQCRGSLSRESYPPG